jgi:hypothetical protein
MTIIKQFFGHSGAIVNLVESDGSLMIEKSGTGIDRNHNRMLALHGKINQPNILNYDNNKLTMSYVPSMDMTQYLINENVKPFINFLQTACTSLESNVYGIKDYLSVYEQRLSSAEWMPAPMGQIIDKLPRHLPQTDYHGDLTLNNILYDYNHGKFVFIDAMDTDLDSIYFDLGKLRQDLDCGWFIRNNNVLLSNRLIAISNAMQEFPYYNNNAIAIVAILRIWKYANTQDKEWLMNQIEKLWRNK